MILKGIELKSAVIGMVIGDGCISYRAGRKNAYYQMNHCDKQYDYLIWKKQILDNITSSSVSKTEKIMNKKRYPGYHLSTRQHPYFTKLYKRFYHNKVKVLDEYLVKMINPLALSIMYMDDGTFGKHHGNGNGKDSFYLCTQNFDYANNSLLRKSLKINFDLEWNLNKANKSKDGTYNYRLRLASRCNDKFLNIIRPHLIPCMQYKLGSKTLTNLKKDCDIVRTI